MVGKASGVESAKPRWSAVYAMGYPRVMVRKKWGRVSKQSLRPKDANWIGQRWSSGKNFFSIPNHDRGSFLQQVGGRRDMG